MSGADGLLLLGALVVTFLGWRVLRGGLSRPAGVELRLTVAGAVTGTLAIAAAMWLFGIERGLLVILSIALHEFGHVAAYRIAGHDDARFRLIPFLGGVAISNRLPASEAHDAFVTLMGPGICLVAVVLGRALLPFAHSAAPDLAPFLRDFVFITAVLNFFNLLPFYPLDGGRIARSALLTFSPRVAAILPLLTSAALVVWAISSRHMFMLVFAVFGLQAALAQRRLRPLPRMPLRDALTVAGAWAAMLWSFGVIGLPIVLSWLG